eukprot:scaffold218310_cov17-Tisochrysis_lutea.AAC.1
MQGQDVKSVLPLLSMFAGSHGGHAGACSDHMLETQMTHGQAAQKYDRDHAGAGNAGKGSNAVHHLVVSSNWVEVISALRCSMGNLARGRHKAFMGCVLKRRPVIQSANRKTSYSQQGASNGVQGNLIRLYVSGSD